MLNSTKDRYSFKNPTVPPGWVDLEIFLRPRSVKKQPQKTVNPVNFFSIFFALFDIRPHQFIFKHRRAWKHHCNFRLFIVLLWNKLYRSLYWLFFRMLGICGTLSMYALVQVQNLHPSTRRKFWKVNKLRYNFFHRSTMNKRTIAMMFSSPSVFEYKLMWSNIK